MTPDCVSRLELCEAFARGLRVSHAVGRESQSAPYGALICAVRLVASLLAVLFASVGCGTQSPAVPTSDYAVPRVGARVPLSGRVIDFTTNAGMSGATIELGVLDSFGKFVAAATAVSDVTGSYNMDVPAVGYNALVQIDGAWTGQIQLNHDYRGDFLVRTGTCVARYGTVADGLTLRPIIGATVMLSGASVVTGANGWYRIDLGCPSNGLVGFNTTFVSVSHRDYPSRSFVAGRGVSGVSRMDLSLQKRDFPCRRDPLIQVCVG